MAPIICDCNNSYSPTFRPTTQSPTKRPTYAPSFKPVLFDYLHTFGSQIVDKNNIPVRISCTTWYGFETTQNIVAGLWAISYKSILDKIKKRGFNTIKIPITNEMLRQDRNIYPSGIDYTRNPDLYSLTSLKCLDAIINYCTVIGLRVILSRYSALAGLGYNEMQWYIPGDPYYTPDRLT